VALLELISVSRHFGGVNVIDGLNLSVDEGELLGMLGPNGAGKSTLFNLIGGNLALHGGSVHFAGRDISRLKAWDRCRLGIGRTYQIPKPFTHMSVFENVLVAAVHGGRLRLKPATERAQDVLDLTGLTQACGKLARELSLLDLKRLELAKALAQRPRLLLLDVVAGGLSETECETLLDIVRAVNAAGTTVVWIEHVLAALRRVATRVDVLFAGTIIASGSPDAVLADARVREIYLGA